MNCSLTTRKVIEMLKENTGSHMLDSGGAYGRNWERNQYINFLKSPRASLHFDICDDTATIESSVNVFWWLTENFSYSPEMQRLFNNMVKRLDSNFFWEECIEAFPHYLKSKNKEVRGIYGDGEPIFVNTYNHESLLSQTLQYLYLEVDQTPYIVLQIHNGCDVRGGYTAPKIFTPETYDEVMFDDCRATICCKNNHSWETDDGGYRYYFEGSTEKLRLDQYKAIELDVPPTPDYIHPDLFNTADTFTGNYEHRGTLVICQGKGYCPICGTELEIV